MEIGRREFGGLGTEIALALLALALAAYVRRNGDLARPGCALIVASVALAAAVLTRAELIIKAAPEPAPGMRCTSARTF
jgi:hypothetical protein